MSSPNEPGYPRAGDRPGSANGSVAGSGSADNASGNNPPSRPASSTGHITDSGDVPPWQRGRPARPPQGPQRQGPESSRPDPSRGGGSGGHSAGGDGRGNRFPSGGSSSQSPTEEVHPPSRNERTDVGRSDAAYASELPDLSGPRPPQRKQQADRPNPEPPSRSQPAGRLQVAHRPARGPVRASMQIRRIDPWSALKVSLVLSVALFFVWMIAVAFLYLVLGGMGVWSKLNSNVGDLLTSASGSTGGELVSSGTIFGGAALIGLLNIVILTALVTAGAFIYNLTTDLVGGVEVTLADRD